MSAPTTPSSVAPAPTAARISWLEKVGYGAGDLASCLYFGIFMNFLSYFYTDVYGLSAAAVATMLFVVRTYDWIKEPIMGIIADRTRSSMGRYRPWLVWVVIPYVICGILTFTTFDLSPTGKLVYAYVTYIVLTMVYTAINVPYSALMGVMTTNSSERTVLSSARFVGAGAGILITSQTMLPLVKSLGGDNPQRGFTLAVCIYAVLAAGAFLFTFFTCKERIQPPAGERVSLKEDLGLLSKNKPWLLMIVVSLFTIISISLRNGTTVYYFKYIAGNEMLAGSFLVAGAITQMVSALFTNKLVALFGGKKRAYIALMIWMALLCFAFYFVPAKNMTLIVVHQILMTLAAAPLMPLFWSMIADTSSYGLWKYGQRSTGLLFSAGTFSQKIGWSIGPALALALMAWTGFKANVAQSSGTVSMIMMLMSVLPGISALLTIAIVAFYPINATTEKEMEDALRAKGLAHG